jgi:hypothetical protein
MPPREDGAGRLCWLMSAIAGAWAWQPAKQREEVATTLGISYLTYAKHRAEMPALDMAVADAMPELMDTIARTLSTRANKRICKRLGIPYYPHYHEPSNLPF